MKKTTIWFKPNLNLRFLLASIIAYFSSVASIAAVHADTALSGNNLPITVEDNNTSVCRLDVDGVYDLVRMPLMDALDHFENNPYDHLAVDGNCGFNL